MAVLAVEFALMAYVVNDVHQMKFAERNAYYPFTVELSVRDR